MLEEAEDDIVQNIDEIGVPKVKVRKDPDAKIFGKGKSVEQLDPFFQEAIEDDEVTNVEKRAVMRDGRVPKMQKNLEKAQKEAAHR